jgi:hypothetical protein
MDNLGYCYWDECRESEILWFKDSRSGTEPFVFMKIPESFPKVT